MSPSMDLEGRIPVTPEEPVLIRSELYPGSAQQFRAQMQRMHNRFVIPLWPPIIEREFLVRDTRGRWESSDGHRLVFREERQLTPPGPGESVGDDIPWIDVPKKAPDRVDMTPETRTTWRVLKLERKERYSQLPHPEYRTLPQPEPEYLKKLTVGTSEYVGGEKQVYYDLTLDYPGSAGIEAYEREDGTTLVEFLDGYDPVAAMDHGLPPTDYLIGPPFEEFCEIVVREVWGARAAQVGQSFDHDTEQIPAYVPKTEKARNRHKRVFRLWRDMEDQYKQDVGFSGVKSPRVEDLRDRAIQELDLDYSTRHLRNIIRSGEEGYLN